PRRCHFLCAVFRICCLPCSFFRNPLLCICGTFRNSFCRSLNIFCIRFCSVCHRHIPQHHTYKKYSGYHSHQFLFHYYILLCPKTAISSLKCNFSTVSIKICTTRCLQHIPLFCQADTVTSISIKICIDNTPDNLCLPCRPHAPYTFSGCR